MPIANCFVAKRRYQDAKGSQPLVDLWALESGKTSEHMTVNIIACTEQQCVAYEVMANLFLPSLWSKRDVNLLQTGLAKALAQYFNVTANGVHVITYMVDSGLVVENGALVEW